MSDAPEQSWLAVHSMHLDMPSFCAQINGLGHSSCLPHMHRPAVHVSDPPEQSSLIMHTAFVVSGAFVAAGDVWEAISGAALVRSGFVGICVVGADIALFDTVDAGVE